MIKLENIEKEYCLKNRKINILQNISATFEKNNFYAIMGRSGSGKTTLVNILGLLDSYTSGLYTIDNIEVSNLSESEKTSLRGKKIGFVFQSFYLNSKLTALENVLLPTLINKDDKNQNKLTAINLLKKLGLVDRINHYPNQLSGGEQQRVAIARALVNNPEILIADEPTGNLDSKNEIEVFSILREISKEGKIVIVVSHNPIIKQFCDVLYTLNDGFLSKEVL